MPCRLSAILCALLALAAVGPVRAQMQPIDCASSTECGAPLTAPTQSAAATSGTGGSIAAGTDYYVVTATNPAGETTASNEQSITTTGSTSANTISWAPKVGATGYRIYKGSSSGGENTYYAVSGNSTVSFVDTGATGTAGTPPSSNTTTGPSNSGTGDAFWLLNGKVDAWGLQLGLFSNQPANEVEATPANGSGIAALRFLVAADIPTIPVGQVSGAVADGSGTTTAGKILVSTTGAHTYSIVWAGVPVDTVTAGTYVVLAGDNQHVKAFSNASGTAVSLAAVGTLTDNNFAVKAEVLSGAGTVTITPTTSTIALNGGSQTTSISLTAGQSATIYSDKSSSACATNGCYWAVQDGVQAGSGLSGMTSGQVAIAGSASTVTSSKALAGSGAGVTTGPTSGTVAGDVTTYQGTTGQTQDSGVALSSLASISSTVTYTTSQTAGASDNGKLVLMNCTAACAYTLPATQPSTAWHVHLVSIGSTLATVALGGSDTYNGTTSVPVLNKFSTILVYANAGTSTDYEGDAPLAAGSGITLTPSSNGLAVALASALPNGTTATTQSAGDNSTKVATTAYVDGKYPADTTTSVGTTAVAANTCTSATTVTMTGVTTSMTFSFTPSADVSAVTGWGSTGGLAIDAWPTANTLNYKVCNQTASSITPSASVTFNVSAR